MQSAFLLEFLTSVLNLCEIHILQNISFNVISYCS